MRRETWAAKKPIANRLKKGCRRIPVDLSGWLPKTPIRPLSTPKAMPQRVPNTMRFMLMVVFGKQPDKSTGMLLQAFFSRFAIGFLAAHVSLRMHPALSGALVGLLVSLPDAFAMKSYVGILGTGLVFGALAGWAAKMWAT